jgi:antitoxin component YwqK of YwqJK toxin-antitoxin module
MVCASVGTVLIKMKKLLILLFSLLISFNSYGETGCSEKDDKEDFINSTIYFQERGGLFYLPNQSEPYSGENLCVYKNTSGQYYIKGEIRKGKRHGKWTVWQENGLVDGEIYFKDGEQVGDTIYEYHYSNDQIESVENHKLVIKDGIHSYTKDGKWTKWYKNGQKESEVNWKEGKQNGKETWWYENGQISLEANFKDDIVLGAATGWHENGQKEFEENYKNGVVNGKTTSWNENGQKEKESNWKDGECVSGDCPD